jgi:Cu(I)-responsive transcriptional regulator
MDAPRIVPASGLPIGTAARAAGISPKMVRHYEAAGLLPAAGRTASGLRRFTISDVHILRFIGRARSLGFPLRTVGALLSLWQDRSRSNAEVRQLAEKHLRLVAQKSTELQGIAGALHALIEACAGDGRPDCPILDDLATAAAEQRAAQVSPPKRGRVHGT